MGVANIKSIPQMCLLGPPRGFLSSRPSKGSPFWTHVPRFPPSLFFLFVNRADESEQLLPNLFLPIAEWTWLTREGWH